MRIRAVAAPLIVAGFAAQLGVSAGAQDPVAAPVVERATYVSSNSSRCVSVPGGAAGDAAVVNITNTAATGNGYGALRSSGTTPVFDRDPADRYSSVNFAANTPPNPNLAIVTIGADNQICYDGAAADHHVILDLTAVIPATAISDGEPTRLLDTRNTNKVTANTSTCVAVPGGTAGDAAVINITNTAATGNGYGALRSSGTTPVFDREPADQYSSVNFAANTPPNPNLAIVTIGAANQICYDGGIADHHVILDLTAIIPATAITDTDPTRLLDTRGDGDPEVRPAVYLNYHGSEQLLGNTDAQWPFVRENLDGFWGHWSSTIGNDAQLQNTIELTRKVTGRELVAEHAISRGDGTCGSPFLEDWFYAGVPGVPGTGVEGIAPDIEYDRVAAALYAGENPDCWGAVGGIDAMLDKYEGQGYETVYALYQATNVLDIDVPNIVFPRFTPGSPGDDAYLNAGALVIECHMDDCIFPSIREEFFRAIEETHARGASFVWFTGYHVESGIGSSGWLENIQRTYNAIAERGLWQPGDAVTLINYNGSYPALPERTANGAPADTVTGILAWLLEQRPFVR